MYRPQKPATSDIVILALAILVIVLIELTACGIAGWNFYRYIMHSDATPIPSASEEEGSAEPGTGRYSAEQVLTPAPALTKPADAGEVRPPPVPSPTATVTLTLVPPTPTQTPVPTNTPTPTPLPPTPTPTISPTPIPTPVAVPKTVVPAPDKWIVVDLSEQHLWAYERGRLVFEADVSTGTDATPTVTGEYWIWVKLVSAQMTGPGYDLPDVPYIMYFYKAYGLHGTYWHDNFGHPMSHGCVNLRTEDAKWLFDWADPVLPEGANAVWATEDNPGTLVIIQP